MITPTQLLIQIVLSVVAAYVVIWTNASCRRRRWLDLFLFFVCTFASCHVVLRFNVRLAFGKELDLIRVLQVVTLIAAVASGTAFVWAQRNSSLRKFRSWSEAWRRSEQTPGWKWSQRHLSSSFGVKMGYLPYLNFLKYTSVQFSQLSQKLSVDEQVAVYHIIQSKEYISWVDVVYWRILRKMADAGISVSVYFYSTGYRDRHSKFEAYVRALLGSVVNYDYNVLERIEISSSQETDADLPDPKKHNYDRLAASAQILPLFMGCKHSFILLWEDYYREMYDALKNLPSRMTFPIENTKNSNSHLSVDLSGFCGAFLLCPTATHGKASTKDDSIVPADTFLLGNYSSPEVAQRISGLCNHSLRIICHEVISPLLGPAARLMLRLSVKILLFIRRDGDKRDSCLATRLIARGFAMASRSIDRRIDVE